MIYKLYSVQEDGSKVLLGSYESLELAQAAQTDTSISYSIELWQGDFATVIY